MGLGIPGFVPERLTVARAARRIASKSALARRLSVSPSTEARWEDGASAPDENAWDSLASALDVRREYFLRPAVEIKRALFYRTLSSSLVRDLDYQKAQMHWLHEISA
ncbi:helix-turn-helix transcriptional regulator, partial [Methylobacterium sp.]|uniref:helix-turn-helix domain-containing protein n=1 Tax=Methylobacterium sp. TaxID=409 RepID=UPI0026259532